MNDESHPHFHMHPLGLNGFDSLVAVVTTAVTAMATAVLSLVPDPTDELKLLLVPLVGALLVTAGTIMLYPERETRNVIIGRASLALVLSTLTPQTTAIIFPSLAPFLAHPVVLLFSGVVLFPPFYVLIRPLFDGMYRRRKVIAEALLERGQQQLMSGVREAVTVAVDSKLAEATSAPAAKQAAEVVLKQAEQVARELKQTAEEVKKAASDKSQ